MSLGPMPDADTIFRLRPDDWNCGNDDSLAGLPEINKTVLENIENLPKITAILESHLVK